MGAGLLLAEIEGCFWASIHKDLESNSTLEIGAWEWILVPKISSQLFSTHCSSIKKTPQKKEISYDRRKRRGFGFIERGIQGIANSSSSMSQGLDEVDSPAKKMTLFSPLHAHFVAEKCLKKEPSRSNYPNLTLHSLVLLKKAGESEGIDWTKNSKEKELTEMNRVIPYLSL